MVSTLLEICNYLPHFYVLMFIVSIGTMKQQTSLSITIILVALAEFIMDSVSGPLLSAMSDKSIEYVVRASIWTSFWCLFYLACVFVFQKFHEWLNLTKNRILISVQLLFGSLSILELARYLDAMLLKTDFIKTIYAAGIPIIGLTIGIYLFSELLLSIKATYANRSDNINRSF